MVPPPPSVSKVGGSNPRRVTPQTGTSARGWGTYRPRNPSVWEAELLHRDSADDAFYPWWGLDVLSNERRLAGECRCLDMILHEKLRETCWGRCPRRVSKEDKSRVVFTSDSLRKQAGIHVRFLQYKCAKPDWSKRWNRSDTPCYL